jgi:hypothetical protein
VRYRTRSSPIRPSTIDRASTSFRIPQLGESPLRGHEDQPVLERDAAAAGPADPAFPRRARPGHHGHQGLSAVVFAHRAPRGGRAFPSARGPGLHLRHARGDPLERRARPGRGHRDADVRAPAARPRSARHPRPPFPAPRGRPIRARPRRDRARRAPGRARRHPRVAAQPERPPARAGDHRRARPPRAETRPARRGRRGVPRLPSHRRPPSVSFARGALGPLRGRRLAHEGARPLRAPDGVDRRPAGRHRRGLALAGDPRRPGARPRRAGRVRRVRPHGRDPRAGARRLPRGLPEGPPGEMFGLPGFLRISFAIPDAKLREGLAILADAISRARRARPATRRAPRPRSPRAAAPRSARVPRRPRTRAAPARARRASGRASDGTGRTRS